MSAPSRRREVRREGGFRLLQKWEKIVECWDSAYPNTPGTQRVLTCEDGAKVQKRKFFHEMGQMYNESGQVLETEEQG